MLRHFSIALGLAAAMAVSAETVSQKSGNDAPAATDDIPLQEIRSFIAAFKVIKNNYVEPISDKELMKKAINGMLANLDPHSEYLDAENLELLDQQTTGNYAGIGVEVFFMDGMLRIVAPMDDGPASKSGIKAGDVILSIDNQAISALEGSKAIDRLKGEAGSEIVLLIARESEEKPLEFKLHRELIRTPSVKAALLEPGYGYLRIAQFQERTNAEMRKKLRSMAKQQPLRGLVLDLRNNPGGLLMSAVEVADAFLAEGKIVETKSKRADVLQSYNARPDDLLKQAPMIVLVDAGTASAAEIVAGALKDNERALIIGQRTFGKGTVQSIVTLENHQALKLTTAKYYTPTGISIQATGIVPDIELKELLLSAPDKPAAVLTERNLPGHLATEAPATASKALETESLDPNDYALNEALHVLKALVLTRANASKRQQG